MARPPFARPWAEPTLRTDRLLLRLPREEDLPEMVRYLARNRERFAPWEPARDAEYFTERYWRGAAKAQRDQARQGKAFRFFGFLEGRDEIATVLSIRDVQRDFALRAVIGYSVDGACEGLGLATETVRAGLRFTFGTLALERVEATVMPANERSRAVLARCGFMREGLSRRVFRMAGAWEDHEDWACLRGEAR